MTENVMVKMKQNLSILGLRNTYENIDEYLGNAIDNKVSLIDFLDLVFEREAKRSVENQIKMAGFPSRKIFELYDFEFQPNLDTDMIDDLRTLRFIGNNENVIFLGTPSWCWENTSCYSIRNKCYRE